MLYMKKLRLKTYHTVKGTGEVAIAIASLLFMANIRLFYQELETPAMVVP